jgi:hypothetical protein
MAAKRKKGVILTGGEPESQEPLVDARIRPLLERYVSMVGAELRDVGRGIVELTLPEHEQQWFRDRSTIRIAFTLDALERDPDAEIAVVGSPLLEQLVAAIRAHGSRVSYGRLAPEHEPQAEAAELSIPITNATAGVPRVDVAWHRVVRLLARVVVQAGSDVEEHLLESRFFDATTGIAVPQAIAAKCAALSSRRRGAKSVDAPQGKARPTADLITLALADLRVSLESKVTRLRENAQHSLEEELRRLDGYYGSLLNDAMAHGATDDESVARRAVEAEHARRRAEEERRHQVRAIVHPVQLTECELLVERATWQLVGESRDTRAELVAERWLNGTGDWAVACPHCRAFAPKTFSLCNSGHVACDTCASTCNACDNVFCRDHGISACHVDGRATCAEHARTCVSCNKPYCTEHELTCAEGDHTACSECVTPCAICSRPVCEEHATTTPSSAPHGQRRLCGDCVRKCEGGANEIIGADEVAQCSSCEKDVCEHHSKTCSVDRAVHCSNHLRRTHGSHRLVCEQHREQCAFEPGTIFATDEVQECVSCGVCVCTKHAHACVEDGLLHCDRDVIALRNEPGRFACLTHGAICHVDRTGYRIANIAHCPVCAKATCQSHVRACDWCGRAICLTDFKSMKSNCLTCSQLKDIAEPSDALVAAVATPLGSEQRPSRWKTARDATHTIVEVHLGWTRRVVIAIRHNDNVAEIGKTHSAVGSKKFRRSA